MAEVVVLYHRVCSHLCLNVRNVQQLTDGADKLGQETNGALVMKETCDKNNVEKHRLDIHQMLTEQLHHFRLVWWTFAFSDFRSESILYPSALGRLLLVLCAGWFDLMCVLFDLT